MTILGYRADERWKTLLKDRIVIKNQERGEKVDEMKRGEESEKIEIKGKGKKKGKRKER